MLKQKLHIYELTTSRWLVYFEWHNTHISCRCSVVLQTWRYVNHCAELPFLGTIWTVSIYNHIVIVKKHEPDFYMKRVFYLIIHFLHSLQYLCVPSTWRTYVWMRTELSAIVTLCKLEIMNVMLWERTREKFEFKSSFEHVC